MTPPRITARAWTALTPRAIPIPHAPATTPDGKPTVTTPFGDTQLSDDAWERAFVRALPDNKGYLVHRAWYALDHIPDGFRDPKGPLDAVALSKWMWWQRCTDYRDPDGTEIDHQPLLDSSQILGRYLDPADLKPFEHLPRTYADAYPLGAIVWDGNPTTAALTHPQLETVATTETNRLLGHLWVGPYRLAHPHYDHGVQRGGVGVRQTPDTHALAWHSATADDPDTSHVHASRGDALRYVVARHHNRSPHRLMTTEPDEEAAP